METPHLEHPVLNCAWILIQLRFSVDVHGGFHMCFELSSHLKDFWIKSIDYPFHPIGLKIGWVIYTSIYIYIFEHSAVETPHLEHPVLNCAWILIQLRFSVDVHGDFKCCFELSSHLKEFWIKSIDCPFHIDSKFCCQFNLYTYIYIYMLAFCCGDPTLRTSHIELRLNIDSTTL